jgi:hypothetical protein
MCDTYLSQTKPASSISSRTSSKRSSVSSAQAKIREAERKEQEALLRLQQSEDEVRRQAAEETTLRELRDKERQIQADRDLRKLKDEVEVQRLSGAIMRQQLAEVLNTDDAAQDSRAQSIISAPSSRHEDLTKPAPFFVNPQATYAATQAPFTQAPATMAVPTSSVITSAYPVTSSAITTPLVGSINKVLTPTRLFAAPTSATTTAAQPKTVTPPTTPKSGLFTQMHG